MEYIVNISSKVLDIRKMEEGKLVLDITTTNSKEIMLWLKEINAPIISKRADLDMNIHIPPSEVHIKTDV